MKIKTNAFFIMFVLLLHSTVFTQLNDSFEGSNIQNGQILGNQVSFEIRHDTSAPGIYRWYSFRIDNYQGVNLDFQIIDALSSSAGGASTWSFNQPVVSSDDGLTWSRITNTSITGNDFNFNYTPQSDSDWIALIFPYQFSRWLNLVNSLTGNYWVTDITNVTNTLEGRPCHVLTITDPDIPASEKEIIWVTARQHCAETGSSFKTEGLINWLIGETLEASILRRKTIFRIAGFMNPDGVVNGNYRYNTAGLDLNRQWDNANQATEPTVYAITQAMLADFNTPGAKIAFFADLHCFSSRRNNFIFYNQHPSNFDENDLIETFLRTFEGINDDFSYADSSGSTPVTGLVAKNWAYLNLNRTPAVTFETSYQDVDHGTFNGQYITIDRYMQLGEDLGKAILSFYFNPGLIKSVVDEIGITDFTGDTDTDPICPVFLSDGRFVFFDTEPGLDYLLLFDPSEGGFDRFTILATEAQLAALAPNTVSPSEINCSSISVDDSDNVYMMISEIGAYDNYVVKVPFSGGSYQAPELVVDVFDGGKSSLGDLTYHRVEVNGAGDEIFISFDNLNIANDTNVSLGGNGIYTFDPTNAPGTTSSLTFLMDYTSLAAGVTPPATPGSDSIGLYSIRLSPDETKLYGVNSNGSGNNDGDIIEINTSTGVASVFVDQTVAETAAAIPGLFESRTSLAVNPTNGNVILLEIGSSDTSRESIYEFAQDGTFLGIVYHHDDLIEALPTLGNNFDMEVTNSIDINTSGDILIAMYQVTEQIICTSSTLTSAYASDPGIIWPLNVNVSPKLTSGFGPRRLSLSNPRYDWHRGIDVPLPNGTRIYAVEDGEIRLSGPTAGFSEPVVQVQHGAGPFYYSTNLHMSGWLKSVGEIVTKGELIGLSGISTSGFAHLHFEVRDGGTTQFDTQNPFNYLDSLDSPPTTPTLIGANLDPSGGLVAFDFDTPRIELDIDGMQLDWNSITTNYSFDSITMENGNSVVALDHPPLQITSSVVSAVMLDRDDDNYYYRFIFANLPTPLTSANAQVMDVDSLGPGLAVNPDIPNVSITPNYQVQPINPGATIVFNHTIMNNNAGSVTLNISARSAQNNNIVLSDTSLNLLGLASQNITVSVDHDAQFASNIGDAILVEISDGTSSHTLIALNLIGNPLTQVPVEVSSFKLF